MGSSEKAELVLTAVMGERKEHGTGAEDGVCAHSVCFPFLSEIRASASQGRDRVGDVRLKESM